MRILNKNGNANTSAATSKDAATKPGTEPKGDFTCSIYTMNSSKVNSCVIAITTSNPAKNTDILAVSEVRGAGVAVTFAKMLMFNSIFLPR